MARNAEDMLVDEFVAEDSRSLLDIASGGKYKTSEDLPDIKSKVIPALEILTGISSADSEGGTNLLNLAMSVPIFGGVLRLGKGIKTASQAVKYLRKSLNMSSKEFKAIHKAQGGDPFKLQNKLISEVGELQKVAVKEAPIAKGIKLGGKQSYVPRKEQLELAEGLGGPDILRSKARLPGSYGVKKGSKYSKY